MRRIHISLPRRHRPCRTVLVRRWLPAFVLLGISGVLAPTAAATSTQAVTNATTGRADASSVVTLDPCGTPTATRAACLTKVLAVRGTGSLVRPRLRQA